MGFKSFMGSIDPGYGAYTGEGVLGKVQNEGASAKILNPLSMAGIGGKKQEEEEEEEKRRAAAGMKRGGSVKGFARGDGIAVRGKTKGRMC